MSKDTELDTFDRSCRHWSKRGEAEMEAFYQLASYDYRLLAEQLNWGKLFRELRRSSDSRTSLLDVACGSGQFPAALLNYGQLKTTEDLTIDYSLLDPSAFSIETARSKLDKPFHADEEFECTIQQFDSNNRRYEMVWATHALYCVPQVDIETSLGQMLDACADGGLIFIAHASQKSHYIRFYDLYLKHLRAEAAEPFITAEQIMDDLQNRVSADKFRAWPIDYAGTLKLQEEAIVERYLQRCLFDDTVSLETLRNDPAMGAYLDTCRYPEEGTWKFPQRVWLIFVGDLAKTPHTNNLSE